MLLQVAQTWSGLPMVRALQAFRGISFSCPPWGLRQKSAICAALQPPGKACHQRGKRPDGVGLRDLGRLGGHGRRGEHVHGGRGVRHPGRKDLVITLGKLGI